MSDILPIDRGLLEEETEDKPIEETKENDSIKVVDEEEPEEESKDPPKAVFEKPVVEEPVISKRTGKPKRKLTQQQLDNLKKAREKSQARRKELKEAKEIQKEQKKMARELKQEEKLRKKEEQEEIIRLKAKMKTEAERHATWDEERLAGLMEKTIENYIKKKKSMKPEPKTFIPNTQLQYPNLPPHAQQQTPVNYTMPQQGYYPQGNPASGFNQSNAVSMRRSNPSRGKTSDPLNSLFGFNPDQ